MIIPKKLRAKLPKHYSEHGEAFFDVYGEHFDDEIKCHIEIDFSSDDPKEIKKLIRWLEKSAKFLDRCKNE